MQPVSGRRETPGGTMMQQAFAAEATELLLNPSDYSVAFLWLPQQQYMI
jgi:hypothetical protein